MKQFFKAANQIVDFTNFLKNQFELKNTNLYNFYSSTNIKAVVCMRFEPDFSIINKSNAQRNTEKLKLRLRLGFEIIAETYYKFN